MARSTGLLTEVETCCGLVSLHRGAYIVAAIYFVLGVCGMGLSANEHHKICSVFRELGLTCTSPFFVAVIVASIIEIIVSVLIVVALVSKNHIILLPWIIWNLILVLLSIAFSMFVAIEYFNVRLFGPESPPGFTAIIISILTAVPTLYCVLVVYSAFRQQGEAISGSMEPLDEETNFKTKL